MRLTHHISIRVLAEDLDELNHVNNIVYLRYIQDAAKSHWFSAASEEVVNQIIWVARRHEIDYLKPAFLGDDLIITTWIDDFSGVTSERHCEIYRGKDILAKSKTIWVALDSKSMRPKRVSSDILEKF